MAIAIASSEMLAWDLSSPIVATVPTGTADGDLLIMILSNSNSAMQVDTPANWTLVGRTSMGSNCNRTVNVFYRIASSEPASYSVTITGEAAGCMLRITGFENSTPVYCYAGNNDDDTDAPVIDNTITPSVSNSLLVFIAVTNAVGSPTGISGYAVATSNPSWTEIGEASDGTYGWISVAWAIRPETSATGNSSFSVEGASSSTDCGGVILAVKRLLSFTSTTLDTTTVTDVAPSMPRARVFTQLDTVTDTDTLTTESDKWGNESKPTTSWSNTSK